jgi:hypothetical protein
MKDAASEIESWFTTHDDGEFVRLPVTHAYSITVPPQGTRHLLYTTKPASVLCALESGGNRPAVQVVGRCGLPNADDVIWLRGIAADRQLLFLGDADPVDLLIFAWLRSQIPVSYAGISDSLIQTLGSNITDDFAIALSDSERAALPLLVEVFPDYPTAIGSLCAARLNQGQKNEIEAVLNFAPGHTTLAEALAR